MEARNFHEQADLSQLEGLEGLLTSKQIKKLQKQATKQAKQNVQNHTPPSNVSQFKRKGLKEPLIAQTEKQRDLIRAIIESEQVVTMGSAGTGKTYVTTAMAADMLLKGEIDRIYITRPNVPTGKSIGYFPGTLEDKMAPWLAPIINVLKETLGEGHYEYLQKNEVIKIIPFEVIRGWSLNNAFVILDEAENTTVDEMKAFLTRIGKGSKVVINGDVKQKDIKTRCGLEMVLHAIENNPVLSSKISTVEFTIEDCVRADIVSDWLYHFEEFNV